MTALAPDTEFDTLAQVRMRFERASLQRKKRLDQWRKNYRLVQNRGWADSRAAWLPAPQASEIYPILSSLIGWMTDQRVIFDYTPAADPGSSFAEFISGLCHDLGQLVHSLWIQHNYDAAVEQCLWDACMYQMGVLKVVWDPGLDDGQGNPLVCRIDPFAFYPDPDATSFDEAEFLIEARKMSWTELERRFPDALVRAEEDTGGGDSLLDVRDDPMSSGSRPMTNPGGYPSAATGSFGKPGQSRERAAASDGVIVYECWLRENETWFDPESGQLCATSKWKVIVCTSNRVLMEEDAEDLWGHARHPYVRYLLEDLGELYGIALVDHLAPCQQALNRLLAAFQASAELVGNPIFMEESRSGIPRTALVNRPGQRLTKTTGSQAEWLTPPAMSPDVLKMIQYWPAQMERISGLSAMQRGMTPTGRNAQGVIDSVQESAFVRVRKSLKNLERTLREVGTLLANLVVENYDLPRSVAIIGPQASQEMMYLKSKHFMVPTTEGQEPVKFAVNVNAGGTKPTSRSARQQEADTLKALDCVDDEYVLEAHDIGNRKEIIARLQEKRNAGQSGGAGGVSRRATRTK